MSRKVIQLLYVVPNDEDFNAAFWNVVLYFEEKGCMTKCGCNVWELSNDLMIFAVNIDTAFLTPKRFNVELDSRQFVWHSKKYNNTYTADLKDVATNGCVMRVDYRIKDGAPIDHPLDIHSKYIVKTQEKAHGHRFTRAYNVSAGRMLDWI